MSSHSIPLSDAKKRGWPTFSVSQSREVDRLAIEQFGITGIELMRSAGEACADRIQRELSEASPMTMILAGAGNNGGDGYVIARVLAESGCAVMVVSVVPVAKLAGDAKISHDDAVAAGVLIEQCVAQPANAEQIVQMIEKHDGMIVDCLLGTGSQGAPRGPFAEAIKAANRNAVHQSTADQNAGTKRVAIDVPSGLNGDTGEAAEPTFRADLTLTFVAPKTGMNHVDASRWTGEIEIIDIGIPLELKQQLGIPG